MSLSLRFLGAPQLQRDGVTLPLPRTRKAVSLLALLALNAGRSVDRKYLAETLWPESDPNTGATNLRQALTILRRALGPDAPRLIAEGYQALRLELVEAFCDIVALDTALQQGERDTAKALYAGPFLEGFSDDWVLVEREKRAAAIAALFAPPRRTQLPNFLTPFLGRATEKARLRELLQREGIRLVSVLGMGGLGKTRLALTVAAEFPEAHFIDLALLPATATLPQIWQALAEALELTPLTEVAVCEKLHQSTTVLLFDNAEHVTETTARVIPLLLSRCPKVKALVTSREPLKIPGEALFRLQPLQDEDAIALFVQRAGLALPGIELPETALRSLCQKLEGLPLALELAAARLRVLQLEDLESHLVNRFRLLRSDQLRVDRHHTLQATLDGSWEQLTSQEKHCVAALSLLIGSWPRTLAQVVAFPALTDDLEVLEVLTQLVDKSWLRVSGGQYSLLETLREYLIPHQPREARQKIVTFAQENISWRRDTESQSTWLQRLELYKDIFRAALNSASLDTKATLAVALGDAFVIQGRVAEGIALYEMLMSEISEEHPTRAALLYFWALLEQAQDNPTKAGNFLTESLHLCVATKNTPLQIRVLGNLGMNARQQGDLLAARSIFLETLELCHTTQEGSPSATLIRLGIVEHDLGNLSAARGYLREAVALGRKQNNEIGLAIALSKLGYVERDSNNPTGALTVWREALTLNRTLGYTRERGYTALALSKLAPPDEAHSLRVEALAAFDAIQDSEGLQRVHEVLATAG